MKYALFLPLAAALFAAHSQAQNDRIYRCGNEYTNVASEAQAHARGCKAIEGNNITVVQGTKVNPQSQAPVKVAAATQAGRPDQKVDAADQRVRDVEARAILESELRKAEARQAELLREYNNGEPEKRGDEARNYQKYLDRTANLKAELARNDSDINGIRRELGRLPGAK